MKTMKVKFEVTVKGPLRTNSASDKCAGQRSRSTHSALGIARVLDAPSVLLIDGLATTVPVELLIEALVSEVETEMLIHAFI